jgi:hypothetical protein
MASATEPYEVKNRFTGEVQFTAQISATPDMLPSVKLGQAVRWGRDNGANLIAADLRGADLRDADLSDADLSGADLSGANLRDAYLRGADLSDANLRDANLSDAYLRGADLRGADLSGANLSGAKGLDDDALRHVIADYWMILSMARHEVPTLVAALRNGRIDGSTYTGECACLVGTLDNAGAKGLPHVASSPAELWFTMIHEGDKPGDESAGGFAATKALAWAERYCTTTGITLAEVA